VAKVPIINFETFLMGTLKMSDANQYGKLTDESMIDMDPASSSDPLSAGKTGTVSVYGAPGTVGRAKPAAGSVPISVAFRSGSTSTHTIYAYETGAAMSGGFLSPERRVYFFLDQGETLTQDGLDLLSASATWAANVASLP